jgi:hypothetical protein
MLPKTFCQVVRQQMQIGQINKRTHLCTIYAPNVLHYSAWYYRASRKRMFQLSRTERTTIASYRMLDYSNASHPGVKCACYCFSMDTRVGNPKSIHAAACGHWPRSMLGKNQNESPAFTVGPVRPYLLQNNQIIQSGNHEWSSQRAWIQCLAHEQHHVRCMACGSQNWDGRQVAARGRTTPRGSCSTGCPLAAGARMSCLCTPPWLWGGMLHAPELPPLVDEVYHGSNGHQVAAGRVVVVPRGTQLLPPPLPRTAADAAFVIQAKPPPSHLGHTAEQPSRPRRSPTAAAAPPNHPAAAAQPPRPNCRRSRPEQPRRRNEFFE